MKGLHKSIKKLMLFGQMILLSSGCIPDVVHSQHVEHKEVSRAEYREESPLGTWWWNNQDMEMQQLMTFAAAQGVNEIYWSVGFTRPHWCAETVVEFMTAAYENGIRVYYLTGDWSWIHDDEGLISRLEAFTKWQEEACDITRFAGVHLNIEPHQDPAWKDGDTDTRNRLLQNYIDLKVRVTDRFGKMDWSVPFWWTGEEPYLVNYRGEKMHLYQASILEANRVFVMSYRNTAEETYHIGQHYVDFAREVGRPIFLSALVKPGSENPEYDHVFYYLKGFDYMENELAKLRELVDYSALGIAVHDICGWYEMWKRDVYDIIQ